VIEIEVASNEDLMRRIDAATRDYPEQAKQSVWEALQDIMNAAKAITPVDTGLLRASGRVDDPIVSPGLIEVEFGFHTDYAIYVHENTFAKHKVGQAKFLERPLYDKVGFIPERIAERLDELFMEGL
jgi:hypothetical protein